VSGGYGSGPVPPGAFRPPELASGGGDLPGAPPVHAEWWRRALAACVDGLILLVLAGVLYGVLVGVGVSLDGGDGFTGLIVSWLLATALLVLAALLYQPIMLARTNGQTLGKMATGIRVVRADGRPMELGSAVLREVVFKSIVLGVAASFTGGLAYLVDWLWPLIDGENRALHDFPVDTRVVRA
jgi:uncharacterized RDD family membrane protein YckC